MIHEVRTYCRSARPTLMGTGLGMWYVFYLPREAIGGGVVQAVLLAGLVLVITSVDVKTLASAKRICHACGALQG